MSKLNPDQFHRHLSEMELSGVPGPGIASVGGKAYPAAEVEHQQTLQAAVGRDHEILGRTDQQKLF